MNEEEMKIEEEVKKVIISTPSDKSESIESARRNTTGKVSINKTPFSSRVKKIEPRYLRNSSGSCHDVCKHGKKHTFEVHQKRLPVRRRSFPQNSNNKESTEPKDSMKLKSICQTKDKEIEQNYLADISKYPALEKESIESSSPKEKRMICHEVVEPLDMPENISDDSDVSDEVVAPLDTPDNISHEVVALLDIPDNISLEVVAPLDIPDNISHEVVAPLDIPDNISVESVICHEVISPLDMREAISDGSESLYMETMKTVSITSETETMKSSARTSNSVEKPSKKLVKKSIPVEEKKGELRSSVLRKAKEKKVEFKGKSCTTNKRTPMLAETNKTRVFEKKGISSSIKKPTISISLEGINKKTNLKSTTKVTNQKIESTTIKKPNASLSSDLTNLKSTSTIKRLSPSKPKISLIKSMSALVPSRKSTAENNSKMLVKNADSTLKSSRFSESKVHAKGGEMKKPKEKMNEKTFSVTEPKTPSKQITKNRKYTPSHSRNSSISSEKKKLVKNPTSNQESKLALPHKLAFQRGKVVNPNSENNSPRKLKFRQGKGLNESPKSRETKKLVFRTRKTSFGSLKELKNSRLKAPDVVLRHQDVKEEKKAQDLLNVVIEETASKLVETRKSKVKALVGAFETVISLQEKRAPTPSV